MPSIKRLLSRNRQGRIALCKRSPETSGRHLIILVVWHPLVVGIHCICTVAVLSGRHFKGRWAEFQLIHKLIHNFCPKRFPSDLITPSAIRLGPLHILQAFFYNTPQISASTYLTFTLTPEKRHPETLIGLYGATEVDSNYALHLGSHQRAWPSRQALVKAKKLLLSGPQSIDKILKLPVHFDGSVVCFLKERKCSFLTQPHVSPRHSAVGDFSSDTSQCGCTTYAAH